MARKWRIVYYSPPVVHCSCISATCTLIITWMSWLLGVVMKAIRSELQVSKAHYFDRLNLLFTKRSPKRNNCWLSAAIRSKQLLSCWKIYMTKSQMIWKWKNKSKLCWITKFRESVLFVNNEQNEYLAFSVCVWVAKVSKLKKHGLQNELRLW